MHYSRGEKQASDHNSAILIKAVSVYGADPLWARGCHVTGMIAAYTITL